jgi:hypothetical protein
MIDVPYPLPVSCLVRLDFFIYQKSRLDFWFAWFRWIFSPLDLIKKSSRKKNPGWIFFPNPAEKKSSRTKRALNSATYLIKETT